MSSFGNLRGLIHEQAAINILQTQFYDGWTSATTGANTASSPTAWVYGPTRAKAGAPDNGERCQKERLGLLNHATPVTLLPLGRILGRA